jgi:predicted Zn finger-like uncharacterized protein
MFMNVTCPACGHKWRVSERMLGQQVKCPACSKSFPCGSVSPPSLATPPTPADQPPVRVTPQAQAAQAQQDHTIHYRCPRCAKPLESPVHMAGSKGNCPDCGQRLQIPHASNPPPPSPVNKTMLAVEEPAATATPQLPVAGTPPAPPAPVTEEILTVLPVSSPAPPAPAPALRESCLECGVDITRRARVLTCPDCGSLFCSAGCYREHSYHAHPWRR